MLGHIHLGLVPGSQSAGEQGLSLCKVTISIFGYPDAPWQVTAPGAAPCSPWGPTGCSSAEKQRYPQHPLCTHRGQPTHENHHLILAKTAFPTQVRIFMVHSGPGGCGGGIWIQPTRSGPALFALHESLPRCELVPSLAFRNATPLSIRVCWERGDKGALKITHGLINATCLLLYRLCGLLIIFIKKIISPNQGRSSPELQLINCSHIFLFYKKSCGADENYRPLESALNTNSDSVTILLPSTASTWLR